MCLVCFKRGAAVLFGQGSGLNAFKVYISASCLSCINQDTLSCNYAPRATKTHDRTARAADCPSKGARWTQVILRPGSYVSFLDFGRSGALKTGFCDSAVRVDLRAARGLTGRVALCLTPHECCAAAREKTARSESPKAH